MDRITIPTETVIRMASDYWERIEAQTLDLLDEFHEQDIDERVNLRFAQERKRTIYRL